MSVLRDSTDFKKAYESVRSEVLNNIIRDCEVPIKLARLIKIWLIETKSEVRTGNHLSHNFFSKMI
jgi:hypothetical protein